jgi:quinol monooxygenase YgiN
MIVRIVKMSFHPEKVADFLAHFKLVESKIRNTAGIKMLTLYQDQNNKSQFFTYSHWESEEALNAYRKSEFFGEVWTFTKTLFNEKPEAWSLKNFE